MPEPSNSPGREILVLVPELFRSTGGVQRYSLRFIEALDRILGTAVTVISLNDRLEMAPESFLEGRHFSGCGDRRPWKRKWNLLRAFRSAPVHRVILSTHPNPSPLLALFKLFTKIPFVTVAHGIDAWNPSAALRLGMRRADLILPVSRYTAAKIEEALSHHCPPLEVVPNMVESRTFFPGTPSICWRERLGLKPDDFVILTIGRIERGEQDKGYDLVLEALPELVQEHPRIHWVLGGQGGDLARLRRKAADLIVSEHCRFPGFVEEAGLPDLYRSSDLFILPSRKEGFGIVFLEAAASGLPVIAGNEDGAVDALAGGALGTLISPRSSREVARAILDQLNREPRPRDEQHADCVGRFGRDAFQERLRKALAPLLPTSRCE